MQTIPCAGALIYDDARRLLLVLRAREPAKDTWSLPGGRCEAGESSAATVVREVWEETGLDVVAVRLVGAVERDAGPASPGRRYRIEDWECAVRGGHLAAGDDAADVCWADAATLGRLPLSPGLLDTLAAWHALPG